MRYIFDFDRTLFATERFVEVAKPYYENDFWLTPAIWDHIDCPNLLYADSLEYLKNLQGHELILLTAWTPDQGPKSFEFQKAKVSKSGIVPYLADVIIMEGDKGPYVKELCGEAQTVFIDDRVDHLLSAKLLCPQLIALQMLRPSVITLPTDPSIPVITELSQINEYITT